MQQVAKMKEKVLDFAVAISLGLEAKVNTVDDVVYVSVKNVNFSNWIPLPKYSSDWSLAGLIIESEKIAIDYRYNEEEKCIATVDSWDFYSSGDTPLIAAMRCFVTHRLGQEIPVPDELIQKDISDEETKAE